ncbi:MAG: class I SAM-dependent rRNA methyltransferase [Pseudomonadota bacterium]
MSINTPILRLKKNEERRLLAGHLWVYSNEVDTSVSPLTSFDTGAQVAVHTSRDQFIAMAYVNPRSLICARVYSHRRDQALDVGLLVSRLTAALQWRAQCYDNDCYRLVHGEGDWLPGLVVDRFGSHLVVQMNTAGMFQLIEPITEALQQVVAPQSILLKNSSATLSLEGLDAQTRVLAGEEVESVELQENGLTYRAPIRSGQKTGWFYDHRDNRLRLQSYCRGKRVLDAYSYLGGWGINALAGGADSCVAIDSSAQALAGAAENARINGFDSSWSGIEGDVSEVLKSLKSERFDVIVLDPPAFIQRAKDKRKGLQKYISINSLAAGLLNDGGLLVSGSCSHHLPVDQLQKAVLQAGKGKNRSVQLVGVGGQAADHPVQAAIPETAYLKCVLSRVVR